MAAMPLSIATVMFKVRVTVIMIAAVILLVLEDPSDQITKKSRKARYSKCTTCKFTANSTSPMQERASIIRDVIIVC